MRASILMVAAENALIDGAKVGGVADVIAGVSPALAALGAGVQIILPSYGCLHTTEGFKAAGSIRFEFANKQQNVDVYRHDDSQNGLTTWIVDHPVFALCGTGKIYCDDPPDRPFATDAIKFSFFCNALAELIRTKRLLPLTHIHLHDWQAGFLLFLRDFDSRYQTCLSSYNYVFSIHNLAYQGIRPLDGDTSSPTAWWPDINGYGDLIIDPRWTDCINPMRTGICLADRVHTVSPSYAKEIQQASDPQRGFYGGEGLQQDLQRIAGQDRLAGILNGCDYGTPSQISADKIALFKRVIEFLNQQAYDEDLLDRYLSRLQRWLKSPPATVCTSVGRINPQKTGLLMHRLSTGVGVLENLLERLGDEGVLLCLGSGDPELEAKLKQVARQWENFVFINGFAMDLSDLLYCCGDLFLMPSQFEPCGISQMLAMRCGQPCVVHGVGGLKDTVRHNINGFVFKGDSPVRQAENLVECFSQALALQKTDPQAWQTIRERAKAERFTWSNSARKYLDLLYIT